MCLCVLQHTSTHQRLDTYSHLQDVIHKSARCNSPPPPIPAPKTIKLPIQPPPYPSLTCRMGGANLYCLPSASCKTVNSFLIFFPLARRQAMENLIHMSIHPLALYSPHQRDGTVAERRVHHPRGGSYWNTFMLSCLLLFSRSHAGTIDRSSGKGLRSYDGKGSSSSSSCRRTLAPLFADRRQAYGAFRW